MPLALLLQEVIATLGGVVDRDNGISRFAPLGELAIIDDKLVERARSAYLVRWFGSGLPYVHLGIAMHIDNIDALRRRYQAVAAQVRKDEGGPNFTEPLAAVAGAAAGTLVSPAGTISLLIAQLSRTNKIVAIFIGILYSPVLSSLALWMSFLGAAAGTLALPAAFAGAIYAGQVNDPTLRAIYDLGGALAVFTGPFVELVKQLTGPRDQVKNPLLRHILDVADRLAPALALALGLVAVLVVDIAPALAALAPQIGPFADLTRKVCDTVMLAVGDLLDQLTRLVIADSSPLGQVIRTFAHVRALVKQPLGTLRAVFTTIATRFTNAWTEITASSRHWNTLWKKRLGAMFKAHPLIRLFEAISVIAHITWPAPRPAAARPPAPAPGFFSKLWDAFKDEIARPLRVTWHMTLRPLLIAWLKSIPKGPSLDLPDVADVSRRAGGTEVAPLWKSETLEALFLPYPSVPEGGQRPVADWAARAVDLAAAPPRMFAPPPLDVDKLAAQDHKLRARFASVIEQVLPPLMRTHLPAVLGLFQKLDEQLYASDEERAQRARHPGKPPAPAFPVLELDDKNQLIPVVRKLRVQVRGGYEPELRAFRDKLDAALHRRTYEAA